MKKCLLIYFSQQGSTKKVAQSIARGLKEKKIAFEFHSLIGGTVPSLDSFDMIGLGFPVYYSNPPFSVAGVVRDLPDMAGKPFFTFTLHGSYRGDASTIIRKALADKNAGDLGYYHCPGENHFYGYLKSGYLFSPGRPNDEDLGGAVDFGRELARRFNGGAYEAEAFDRPAPIMYRIERFALNEWIVRNLYSRLFRVDKNRCTDCGACVKACPTGNIARDEKGRLIRGRNCILCLACESVCPGEAVRSPLMWTMNRPVFRYNIAQGRRDPSISHERVSHVKGKVVRN